MNGIPNFPRVASPEEREHQQRQEQQMRQLGTYPDAITNMAIKLGQIQAAKDAIQMQAGRISPKAMAMTLNTLEAQEQMLLYHINSMAESM